MNDSDEQYIIELCDCVLKRKALRHASFEFLRGDPGRNGRCRKLPVDGYYKEFNLVVEYQELQHFESISIMDKKWTCSGCDRGQQRRLYDQRRRDILPKHGICLIELPYYMFEYDPKKRLRRNRAADAAVLEKIFHLFVSCRK